MLQYITLRKHANIDIIDDGKQIFCVKVAPVTQSYFNL